MEPTWFGAIHKSRGERAWCQLRLCTYMTLMVPMEPSILGPQIVKKCQICPNWDERERELGWEHRIQMPKLGWEHRWERERDRESERARPRVKKKQKSSPSVEKKAVRPWERICKSVSSPTQWACQFGRYLVVSSLALKKPGMGGF